MRQPFEPAEQRQDTEASISRLGALLLVAEGEWERHLQQSREKGSEGVSASCASAYRDEWHEHPGLENGMGAVRMLVSSALPAAGSAGISLSQCRSAQGKGCARTPSASRSGEANPLKSAEIQASAVQSPVREGLCKGNHSRTFSRKRVRWPDEDQSSVHQVHEYEYLVGQQEEMEKKRRRNNVDKSRLPYAQAASLGECARNQTVRSIQEAGEADGAGGGAQGDTRQQKSQAPTVTLADAVAAMLSAMGAGGTCSEAACGEGRTESVAGQERWPAETASKAASKRARTAKSQQMAEEKQQAQQQRAAARRLAMLEFEAAVIRRSLQLCAK